MTTFATRFRELRKTHDLTQERIAIDLSVSKSTIAMWETSKRIPSYEKLEEIADYFNVDMNFLLGKQAVNTFDSFTLQEIELLNKYRLADEQTKEMINRILLFTYIQEKEGGSNESN